MDIIKLVQGDSKPVIILTLKDESTGSPLDLSGPTTTVVVKFRQSGSDVLLSTIPCTNLTTGIDGKVQFDFSGGVLSVEPGMYEGEVEITFGPGGEQTVYDILRFRVRQQF